LTEKLDPLVTVIGSATALAEKNAAAINPKICVLMRPRLSVFVARRKAARTILRATLVPTEYLSIRLNDLRCGRAIEAIY